MAREIAIVPFSGLGNWSNTRPSMNWEPFGGDNGAKGKEPTYWAKHRDGSQTQIYNDMNDSDIEDKNRHGIWTSTTSADAYSHRVNHKNAHSSFMQLGWDSNSSASAIENAGNIAPIRNFSGMSFWWDRVGSYWSDSAINIDSVYFTIYDGEAQKPYQQKAQLSTYSGLNPEVNGDPSVEFNRVYYKTSNSDWNWCSNNKRFLVGITIQFYQKGEGGASHSRVFKIYNLQPIFGASATVGTNSDPAIAHQMQMNYTTLGAIKQAMMSDGGKSRPYITGAN